MDMSLKKYIWYFILVIIIESESIWKIIFNVFTFTTKCYEI